ncbi:MAG: MoaD/ThiS family protein [Spirochaetota bacterium]
MQITVKYFAALAEHAGKSEEQIQGEALAIEPLYQELKQRYQFPLEFSEVRAAVNTRYVQPDTPLAEGDVLVFISPVAGG